MEKTIRLLNMPAKLLLRLQTFFPQVNRICQSLQLSDASIRCIRLNYSGWLAYFIVYNFYCIFWRQYAVDAQYSLFSSLVWFAKEWAVWLVISPCILLSLDRLHHKKTYFVLNGLLVGVVFLSLAFTVRVHLNEGEYPFSWGAVVVIIFPKYLAAYAILFLAWFLLKSPRSLLSTNSESPASNSARLNSLGLEPRAPESNSEGDKPAEPQLEVEHRGLRVLINLAQIYSLKAAGNYIEIDCGELIYLKRGTLKQMLDALPQSTFTQVHRSFAININHLSKLSHADSGGGLALLANDKSVPVSKRYKPVLKSLLLTPKTGR